MQKVLQAVADPIRLSLLRQLAAKEPEEIPCGVFDLPVGKSGLSHHFAVLRMAGLLEQRDQGQQRLNRLRREEVEAAFPGLLALVLRDDGDNAARS
ncbi:helix-turn-helix domain-containing protein [Saccharothrix sp. S26]|uniref:ArsR/SmtB family transcription factor n=1 Tax=Saccharothrix sp. S26 TaxID=2907215 RepID=UPI0027E14035|nr:helix-turn-helix domain-containing protein [Saccharothrix sp. S26]